MMLFIIYYYLYIYIYIFISSIYNSCTTTVVVSTCVYCILYILYTVNYKLYYIIIDCTRCTFFALEFFLFFKFKTISFFCYAVCCVCVGILIALNFGIKNSAFHYFSFVIKIIITGNFNS